MKTDLILLAAGSSSRLGRPKQLIDFQGEKLLLRATHAVKNSQVSSMVVVLGWNPELIKTAFDSSNIDFVVNPNWEDGMASSMQAGLRFLIQKDSPDQVIIMLCDQPFVDAGLLDSLIHTKEKSGKGIIACSYSDTLGVPALFDKVFFEELLAIKSSEGAKKVIFQNLEEVIQIDFPLGAVDLDTEEDLLNLKNLKI